MNSMVPRIKEVNAVKCELCGAEIPMSEARMLRLKQKDMIACRDIEACADRVHEINLKRSLPLKDENMTVADLINFLVHNVPMHYQVRVSRNYGDYEGHQLEVLKHKDLEWESDSVNNGILIIN